MASNCRTDRRRVVQVLQKPYYQQFLWCCGKSSSLCSASELFRSRYVSPRSLRNMRLRGPRVRGAGVPIIDCCFLIICCQSLIAPLGSFSLTANILVAPCFLKETITRHDLIATGITRRTRASADFRDMCAALSRHDAWLLRCCRSIQSLRDKYAAAAAAAFFLHKHWGNRLQFQSARRFFPHNSLFALLLQLSRFYVWGESIHRIH